MSHTFWIDLANRKLVTSRFSKLEAPIPEFTQGDSPLIELRFMMPTGGADPFYEEMLLPEGTTVRVAIGKIDTLPARGKFRIGYISNATPWQPHNVSADVLTNAFNLLPSVAVAGGVTVLGQAGGPWLFYWNVPGERSAITADTTQLQPSSQAVFHCLQKGSVTSTEIQKLKLKQLPATWQGEWTDTYNRKGKTGILRLDTVGIEDLLAGREFVETFLEIEITTPNERLTILQTKCRIFNDMIEDAPMIATPLETAFTSEAFEQMLNTQGLVFGDFARIVPVSTDEGLGIAIETRVPLGEWELQVSITSETMTP